jgi:hypothetical protein
MYAVPVSQRSLSYFWSSRFMLIASPTVERKRSVVDFDLKTGVLD